jgi:DNA-directed RNA polymerase specialized sigma24 family protein
LRLSLTGGMLVVPSKAFRQEWLPRLERENVKVYSGAHDGQACFFLKAVEGAGKAETVQEPLSLENASKLPAWTSEETEALLKLRSEGLTFEEIAKRIGKSEGACYSK